MKLEKLPILLLLIAGLHAHAGEWLGLSAPLPITDACVSSAGLWLATGGGIRLVDSQLNTREYTAADGLGETSQAAVVLGEDSSVYAISANGVISRFVSENRFEVLSRSFVEFNSNVVKGLMLSQGGFLTLGFSDRISFFDVAAKVSRMSVIRVGGKSLSSSSLNAMLFRGDTLYLAIDSTVYRRHIPFSAFSKEFDLADPSSWTQVLHSDSGQIQALWVEAGKLKYGLRPQTVVEVSTGKLDQATPGADGALVVAGKSIADSLTCPGDSCFPSWMVRASGTTVWFGNDSTVSLLQGSSPKALPKWKGIPPFPVTTLALLPDGGISGWAIPEIFWLNGATTSLHRKPYKTDTYYDESSGQSFNQPLKGMLPNAAGDLFLGTWGGGLFMYENGGKASGGAFTKALHPWYGSCMSTFSQMAVSRGMARPDGANGVVASFWSDAKTFYGLTYVDTNSVTTCLNQIGSSNASGPLAAGIDSATGNWQFFSAYAPEISTYTSGGIDWIATTNPETSGEFTLLAKVQISTGSLGYPRDLAWDPLRRRLWVVSSSTIGWWDESQTEVIPVLSLNGFKGGDFTAVELDAQGNPWFGTKGQGMYHGQMLHDNPDSLTMVQYLPRDGLLSSTVLDLKIDVVNGRVWTAHELGVSQFSTTLVRQGSQYQQASALPPRVFPNPFRPRIHQAVVFDRVSDQAVLRIFDSGGNLVRKFSGKALTGGRLAWDGKTENGALVSPGVYTWVSALGKKTEHGRLMVIR